MTCRFLIICTSATRCVQCVTHTPSVITAHRIILSQLTTGSQRPRSTSPSSVDSNVNQPSKTQKVTRADTASSWCKSTGKPRVTDFGEEFHASILLACKYYQVLIATETGFPTKLEQDTLACEAWELANCEYHVSLIATSDVHHVVRVLFIHINLFHIKSWY